MAFVTPTLDNIIATAVGTYSATNDISLTFAVSPIEDDVVIMRVSATDAAAAGTPTGWVNLLGAGAEHAVSTDMTQSVWGHVVTAAEDAANAVTFTATDLWTGSETGSVTGCIVRGLDGTDLANLAGRAPTELNGFFSSTAVTPHTIEDVTPALDDCLVLAFVAKDGTGAYSTPPTDWDFVVAHNVTQSSVILVHEDLTTASVAVAQTSVTPSGSDEYTSITIVFRPSAASATAPGVPTLVRPDDAFGYDSDVPLSYTAPASDGGSAITGYDVEVSTNDQASWSSYGNVGNDTTPVLTGLTLGTRYEFRVRAVNAIGAGDWTVGEWGCTPIAATSPQTPPVETDRTGAGWAISRIDQRAGPAGTTATSTWTGDGVRIYVIDGGVRSTHDEFDGQAFAVHHSFDGTPATTDQNGHGTRVASGAVGPTVGVAYDATLISVRSYAGVTGIHDYVDGFEWIRDNHPAGTPGIVVTSLLMGTSTDDVNGLSGQDEIDAIDPIIDDIINTTGMAVVQCMGNGFSPTHIDLTPQPGLVFVGGSAEDDDFSADSDLETYTTIIAPQEDVPVASDTSDTAYTTGNGNSFGTPLVAGAMACWLEANPDLTPRQLVDLLLAWSTKDALGGTSGGAPNRLLYTLADVPPPSAATWTGSTATVDVTATSGSFSAGAATWTGSTATIDVVPSSGAFTPGASTWTGTPAVVEVTATTGAFTPGTAVWSGSPVVVDATADPGSFTPGAVTWPGTPATVDVEAISGSFSASATWTGSAAAIEVAATSGSFTPGTATWVGSAATIEATATSGAFTPGAATWVGSAATVEVSVTSGQFVAEGGPQTWLGSTALIGVTATPGAFTPGAVSWLGSTAAVEVSAASSVFTSTATWTGSTASINVAATSGSFAPGTAAWAGTAVVVELAGISGVFLAGPVDWTGHPATVVITATSGTFVDSTIVGGIATATVRMLHAATATVAAAGATASVYQSGTATSEVSTP